MIKILALASEIVGTIDNPLPSPYKNLIGTTAGSSGGLILFFTNVIRLVFLAAGLYSFLNFIIAGYMYMSAGGDAKYLGLAWARIWQSLLGLTIVVGSFALAALFGYVFFGDAGYILNPQIYGPTL